MRKISSIPGALAWMLAAALTLVLPLAPSARAASASANLISANLPAGVTLSRATVTQTATALGAAVSQSPAQAATLTRSALLAKSSKKRKLSSDSVVELVQAALIAAPKFTNDIIQVALTLFPEYADALNALAANPEEPIRHGNGPDGFVNPTDQYGGFGVGFGPGFPGSPGFTGSTPSGAIALPPTAVTNTLNG